MTKLLAGAFLLLFSFAAAAQTPEDSVAFAGARWQITPLAAGAECRRAQIDMFDSRQTVSVVAYPARNFTTEIIQLDGKASPTSELGKAAGADAALLTPDQVTPASLSGVSSVAMGCPAMGSEVLEEMEFQPMFDSIKNQMGGKAVGLFGSFGWGDGEWMRSWEKDCDDAGINRVCDSITCCEAPDDDVLAACQAMGRKLAE